MRRPAGESLVRCAPRQGLLRVPPAVPGRPVALAALSVPRGPDRASTLVALLRLTDLVWPSVETLFAYVPRAAAARPCATPRCACGAPALTVASVGLARTGRRPGSTCPLDQAQKVRLPEPEEAERGPPNEEPSGNVGRATETDCALSGFLVGGPLPSPSSASLQAAPRGLLGRRDRGVSGTAPGAVGAPWRPLCAAPAVRVRLHQLRPRLGRPFGLATPGG
jgi:hypothetical protein